MSKQQYECTVLIDASNGQTVMAESPQEAAELACDAAVEEGAGSLCHYCSKHTEAGDVYGVVVYQDGKQVLDTTYATERENDLNKKIDALQQLLNARDEEIGVMRRQLDALLNHCEDGECTTCAQIICPVGDGMHFHHDGCPGCADAEAEQMENQA